MSLGRFGRTNPYTRSLLDAYTFAFKERLYKLFHPNLSWPHLYMCTFTSVIYGQVVLNYMHIGLCGALCNFKIMLHFNCIVFVCAKNLPHILTNHSSKSKMNIMLHCIFICRGVILSKFSNFVNEFINYYG